jgi:hypothetical protein
VRYTIDKDRRLVIAIAPSVLDFGDVIEHMKEVAADPDFNPTYSHFVDFSAVKKMKISGAQMRELARRDIFDSRAKRAAFAPQLFVYGLARMYAMYREAFGGQKLRVFRNRDAALVWLFEPEMRKAS